MKQNLNQLVKDNFVSLTYREKYNLPFNDERILSISEFDMYLDLMLSSEYKKYIKEKVNNDNFDFDEESNEKDQYTLDDLRSGKVNHIHVGGFSKEEIENFWNDDSILK